jgi:hypothetical protein
MRIVRWIVGIAVLAGLAAFLLGAGSGGTKDDNSGGGGEAARVEPIAGTSLNRVVLTPDAARRLGIATGTVERRGRHRTVIPYDAVLYDPEGGTFTYTNPEKLVFVRHSIAVRRIVGGRALLTRGPRSGTAVVTVGGQELFGTEYAVEED